MMARNMPPAAPPAIAAIGTDEDLPFEGECDVGVWEPLVTVRVTTSTRTAGVASNSGFGDMGEGRKGGERRGEQEAKGSKSRTPETCGGLFMDWIHVSKVARWHAASVPLAVVPNI